MNEPAQPDTDAASIRLPTDTEAVTTSDTVRDEIGAALDAFVPPLPTKVASMVTFHRKKVEDARARGASFVDVAKIFTAKGLAATHDAVRVAFNRNKATKIARPVKGSVRRNTSSKPNPASSQSQAAADPQNEAGSSSRASVQTGPPIGRHLA